MRTYSDYEVLRHFALEGGEWRSGIKDEATVLILRGTAAWMRSCREKRMTVGTKRSNPCLQSGENDLSMLLANMIES